ncbi:adenine phosphoribosyltransferase 5-like isoform X2 [Tasmannia lanceolata]|uniref:adenine phosphoribosyltransferase 5-like isoform X2 n=1 Tax=Tasmannia lanceolata TaxID=3420 RepID=UPI004062C69B
MFAGEEKDDPRLEEISSAIRTVPHFKKPGLMFQDITTLLLHPKAFKHSVDMFIDHYRDMNISVVAGAVISESYALEYGTDCLEMHVGAVEPGERAVVIDDLVATGGTLCAAIKLLEREGAEVVECACVVGLPELKGCTLSGKPVYILVEPHY